LNKKGITLVFVHGMFCRGDHFNDLFKHFQSLGYHCMSPTLRYHDRGHDVLPDPRLATTSLVDYQQDLKEILIKLPNPYILMGHSMGGLVVMKAAGLKEVNPKGIILLSPAPPWGVVGITGNVLASFSEILSKKNFWERSHAMSEEKVIWSMTSNLSPEDQEKVYDLMGWESGKVAFEIGFWLLDCNRGAWVNRYGINCPITLFVGKLDRITPHSVVKQVAKFLDVGGGWFPNIRKACWGHAQDPLPAEPHVKLIALDGLYHWLPIEMDITLLEEEIAAMCADI